MVLASGKAEEVRDWSFVGRDLSVDPIVSLVVTSGVRAVVKGLGAGNRSVLVERQRA